jgi:cytochrome c5
VFLFAACLAGCGDPAGSQPAQMSLTPQPERIQAEETTSPSAAAMAQWARSCALCHVNGEGGAPVVGDIEEWRQRAAPGEETLLSHTIEGFNNMPPLGYCMDCEEFDFRTLIRFMAAGS